MKFLLLCRFEDYMYAYVDLRGKRLHVFYGMVDEEEYFDICRDQRQKLAPTKEEKDELLCLMSSMYPQMRTEKKSACNQVERIYTTLMRG